MYSHSVTAIHGLELSIKDSAILAIDLVYYSRTVMSETQKSPKMGLSDGK